MLGCVLFLTDSCVGDLVLNAVVKCKAFKRIAVAFCLAIHNLVSHACFVMSPSHEAIQPRGPLKEPMPCNWDFRPLNLWARQSSFHCGCSALDVWVQPWKRDWYKVVIPGSVSPWTSPLSSQPQSQHPLVPCVCFLRQGFFCWNLGWNSLGRPG